ncbi:MAG: glycosyltransferase family 2 protein [Chitinophagaceae bacterium]
MNDALISVIIPFLNPGNWLAVAIESVINQTYENWEIILVDDGSVREDSGMAMAYSKKFYNKVFYVEHNGHVNKGLTVSRNTGIGKAKGELVAFLDADDCWLPEKLINQLNLFKRFPEAQMICEASCFWYSWKDAHKEDVVIQIGVPQGIYHPPELMKKLYPLGEGQPPCPSGIIIKKDALQRSGGFEEIFSGVYQLYEDQAFLSKVYSKEIIYISAEANNLYRKRDDSMSSAANDEDTYKKVRLFYHAWLEHHFSTSHAGNADIMQLIADFKNKLTSS